MSLLATLLRRNRPAAEPLSAARPGRWKLYIGRNVPTFDANDPDTWRGVDAQDHWNVLLYPVLDDGNWDGFASWYGRLIILGVPFDAYWWNLSEGENKRFATDTWAGSESLDRWVGEALAEIQKQVAGLGWEAWLNKQRQFTWHHPGLFKLHQPSLTEAGEYASWHDDDAPDPTGAEQ